MPTAEPCPACGSVGGFEDDALIRCPACGLARLKEQVFLEPDYSGLDEADIYIHSKRVVISELVAELKSFMPGGGRLLDVGCASGELMKASLSAGWECHGVEVSAALAGHARAAGFPVHEGTLETFAEVQGFDAVIFYEVLSLVADPRQLLKKAFALLKPGGRVFIRAYNGSFHLRTASLSGLAPLRALGLRPGVVHNWNYTPASMRALLEGAGFADIELRNARPSYGDPYGTGGRLGSAAVSAFKTVYYAVSSVVSAVTGGRALISSVFNVRAGRPGGRK